MASEVPQPRLIAKTSGAVLAGLAALAAPSLFLALADPSPLRLAWLIGHLLVAHRVAQLGLEVSRDGVRVVNFTNTILVPIWEAEVRVSETEGDFLLSDMGGKYDKGGRNLLITRNWKNAPDVQVRVAPRFGGEFDRIHDELIDAIAAQRAAW